MDKVIELTNKYLETKDKSIIPEIEKARVEAAEKAVKAEKAEKTESKKSSKKSKNKKKS